MILLMSLLIPLLLIPLLMMPITHSFVQSQSILGGEIQCESREVKSIGILQQQQRQQQQHQHKSRQRSSPSSIHHHEKRRIFFYLQDSNWNVNPALNLPFPFIQLHLQFLPNNNNNNNNQALMQGTDFHVHCLEHERHLPIAFNHQRLFQLTRCSLELHSSRHSWFDIAVANTKAELVATAAMYCNNANLTLLHKTQNTQTTTSTTTTTTTTTAEAVVKLGVISNEEMHCPTIPTLPGATRQLTEFLHNTMKECRYPLISNVSSILSRISTFSTMDVLYLDPPIIVVNGSDVTNKSMAANIVDKLLSRVSVLDVVWEPVNDDIDPLLWILMPKRAKVAGRMHALFDMLQFQHSIVGSKAQVYPQFKACSQSNSDNNNNNAFPLQYCSQQGCRFTGVARVTQSGLGADSLHLALELLYAIKHERPIQLLPAMLPHGKYPGWIYMDHKECPSHFLDCHFLRHSPCPHMGSLLWNKTRDQHARSEPNIFHPHFVSWLPLYLESPVIVNIYGEVSRLFDYRVKHALSTYFLRPQYALRQRIHQLVHQFSLTNLDVSGMNINKQQQQQQDRCAVLHVRRGDILMHPGEARAYIALEAYIRNAKPMLDALHIKTIMLMTDSDAAIEEAKSCSKNYPETCQGLKFRYVKKPRFQGAEGGWEKHFPSQNSLLEMETILLEFSLSHQCVALISGQSNYAEILHQHMCCGYPLSYRGQLPRECFCPPRITLQQRNFNCENGNTLMCSKEQNLRDQVYLKQSTDLSFNVSTLKRFGFGVKLATNDFEIEITPSENSPHHNKDSNSAILVKEKYTKFLQSIKVK